MTKSKDGTTDFVLRYIGKEKLSDIDTYIEEVKARDFTIISSEDEIGTIFNDMMELFHKKLSSDDERHIRTYTGISFRNINSILRGIWDCDLNGKLTEELKTETKKIIKNMTEVFKKSIELPTDIKVYRGVNIRAFYPYGITRIEDLPSMVGQYFYEQGFTSTSLLKSTSFFECEPEYGPSCNIEIEYSIPTESDDGIILATDSLTYSKSQNEFLIRRGSLSKITSVEIKDDLAHMKMILVPEKVWNEDDYIRERKG